MGKTSPALIRIYTPNSWNHPSLPYSSFCQSCFLSLLLIILFEHLALSSGVPLYTPLFSVNIMISGTNLYRYSTDLRMSTKMVIVDWLIVDWLWRGERISVSLEIQRAVAPEETQRAGAYSCTCYRQ